jgi:adenine-specific DNA-methyltransferase
MQKLTATDPETKSPDLAATNLAALRALFPELVTEGPDGVAVNLDVLKQLVGDQTVTDAEEKYGLNWHGKRRARQLALTPSTGTLRPCPEDSVDWDTTQNLMIEGDNLEVLKLLQKSYAGKVKLIYIDPPYNTGKDFVYPDNFQDNIKNYLELTGQTGEGGKKLSSNTEASGRFHTDWLNMMYPRLKLARNLLQADGLIMVSIDEHEIHNLKTVLADVVGEENLVATFVWETKQAARGVPPRSLLMENHEYIVCFSRVSENVRFNGLERDEADFSNPDNDPRGLWRSESMKATGKQDNYFAITDPNTGSAFRANWAFAEGTVRTMIGDGLVLFPPTADGVPRQKKFIDSYTNDTKAAVTSLRWHSTETSTRQIMDLFEGQKLFDFPKPLSLMEYLCGQATNSGDIVMDFFAGSGTTAQAVMAKNAGDMGNRRYVLVQLPERFDPENNDQKAAAVFCGTLKKPRTIAELTKERLRRAGKKIRDENPLFAGDLGFRVFKLASSNIRAWEPDRDKLAETLEASIEHLKTDRTEQDILFELLLKLGLDLCVLIETKQVEGAKKQAHDIHSIGGGSLLVCLSPAIPQADVEPLALGLVAWHKALKPAGETTVVLRDSAFADDVAKTNLTAILQQHGLETVRSL